MIAKTEIVCEDPEADDVDLAFHAGRTWVAWSSASLERETVRLSRRGDDGTWSTPVPLVEDASVRVFRPTLAPLGTGVLLVGCARGDDGYSPVALIAGPDGRVARFAWSTTGDTFEVAAAGHSGRGDALVAWVEGSAGATMVRVGRIDQHARLTPVALPTRTGWQASPALACQGDEACAAWIEGDTPGAASRLIVARLLPGRNEGERITILAEPMASSPALTILSGGEIVVAWHAPLEDESRTAGGGESVLRWPRLAVVDPNGGNVLDMSPPGEAPASRASAGEDQGWEFPALATSAGDVLWLAGRSAQGFHLQASDMHTRRWSARLPLSEHVWGGRGRRLAARTHPEGGVTVARREPDGVVLSHIAEAPILDRAAASRPAAATVPSRAAAVAAAPPAPWPRTLFGDLHRHSAHSDGLGSAEDLWQDARDRRHLDFAALTDHDRLSRCSYGPATWDYHRQVVAAFHDPGRFVAFPAYEFTGPRHPGPGHKCIYFADEVPDRVPPKDLAEIFAYLRRTRGIAVPHHITWTGADIEHHDPVLQPVWEICSVHGCCDREDAHTAFPPRTDPVLAGHFARDALDGGLRFGFIGGTDSHGLLWHHGISPKRDPFSTGLAAVVGAEPTRSGILDALRMRRCFATTGVRIHLNVDFDGAPMGAELPAGTAGRLGLRVRGTAPLARVTIVRPGGDTVIGAGVECGDLEATVDIVPDPKRSWEYLYLQVVQSDGEMAWSSPIWIG
ncbi:MAG: CehA/McbA family metallohydrolase [Deltaproteobacteria bacterium]|nr:CehA/McbA family metallohydrolase [Deltaproteobacteria bacterium]